ncbi:hypothetical protein RD136_004556 [Salmonella enterica]|nr:hypothetical protein [Salmonella enterica]EBD7601708.1 hypothetical protein [Salmonella enterica]EEU7751222.1 hypothetical protein [Salmonella enterica]EHF8059384.1 hypothetical protein [Salmonella enterica subsp. enterica serovar Oranienburg]EKY9498789.1 hypothetical protein [Salmonella enterica]
MNVILWMWGFVPCFLAFICVGIVCVLTEKFLVRKILQMKTGPSREHDRTGVRLLTGGTGG